ncbi:MAG: aspartate kinase [Prevotellaceae bacterium]|nr:aspartate kinase [Prevotellaceae bacterium]
MIVYKFGGASVRSAEGIKNIVSIVSEVRDDLFIVVSAMGKTTNAMEQALACFMRAEKEDAWAHLAAVQQFHAEICNALFKTENETVQILSPIFAEIKELIMDGVGDDYDRWYDHLVSYGEIISTTIVAAYLKTQNIDSKWLDMRKLLITDSNFREANVNIDESRKNLRQAVDFQKHKIYIGQGFIGANLKGVPTTLGREGSDYTAAVVANLLNAKSVTIWKDVPGILNADPRIFKNTVLIPELTYADAVELAYSGAQIIHPKTIKPLENENIPLFVRPFANPDQKGSIIKDKTQKPIDIPVLILRANQTLVSIRPRDFSFVLEDSLSHAFGLLTKHRIKVSLIQSSAVSISVCVDNTRYLPAALDELANNYRVTYNDNLQLLTIRGTNRKIEQETTADKEILLSQHTRRISRYLLRAKNRS